MRQVSGLRYGENPHQPAAFYSDLSLAEHGKGGIATALLHHGKEVSSCLFAQFFAGDMDAVAAASQMQVPWCMPCVMHWGMPYHACQFCLQWLQSWSQCDCFGSECVVCVADWRCCQGWSCSSCHVGAVDVLQQLSGRGCSIYSSVRLPRT